MSEECSFNGGYKQPRLPRPYESSCAMRYVCDDKYICLSVCLSQHGKQRSDIFNRFQRTQGNYEKAMGTTAIELGQFTNNAYGSYVCMYINQQLELREILHQIFELFIQVYWKYTYLCMCTLQRSSFRYKTLSNKMIDQINLGTSRKKFTFIKLCQTECLIKLHSQSPVWSSSQDTGFLFKRYQIRSHSRAKYFHISKLEEIAEKYILVNGQNQSKKQWHKTWKWAKLWSMPKDQGIHPT